MRLTMARIPNASPTLCHTALLRVWLIVFTDLSLMPFAMLGVPFPNKSHQHKSKDSEFPQSSDLT